MVRSFFALLLCLALTLSPALATGNNAAVPTEPAATQAPAVYAAPSLLFPRVKTYVPFSDVKSTHWAVSYVKLCYETGLMVGWGHSFAPEDKVTNADACVLAARIHAAARSTTFEEDSSPWYQGAVTYLNANGIPTGAPSAYTTRQGFFELLSAALLPEMLPPINRISTLPDTRDPIILRFYNAGILTGVDRYGTFAGDKPLSRAECAAMTARIVDPSLRTVFTPAGQVPAAPFPDDAVVLTVNGTPVTYDRFSATMLSLMEETQALFMQYGLQFSWEENYGNEVWDWNEFFRSATVHSAAAELLASARAAELGCSLDDLARTLFGAPTQAELDAYAAEHDIPALSPDAYDALAELVLEEKLNAELGKWVEAATVVTTGVYDELIPKELWELCG